MTLQSSIVCPIYRSGKLYDVREPVSAEYIAYWSSLAQACGSPILEIMCGTGAISIPLAKQGYQVTGLDLAETMLGEARRKSAATEAAVKWVLGDARHFDLGEKYNLIFLPSNSICHLLTREDLEACLASVARHLLPNGRFAVTIFVPRLPLLMKTTDEEQPYDEYIDPDSGEEITVTNRSRYDAATQILYNYLYKRVGDGTIEPDGELMMRMYFPQELDALFWYNGFAIEHKYVGRDRSPFISKSTMQFYVLKRR